MPIPVSLTAKRTCGTFRFTLEQHGAQGDAAVVPGERRRCWRIDQNLAKDVQCIAAQMQSDSSGAMRQSRARPFSPALSASRLFNPVKNSMDMEFALPENDFAGLYFRYVENVIDH